MDVAEVMTRNVITVRADAPVKYVVDLLLANDISGVPVVNAAGTVVGIVTEADLSGKAAGSPGWRRRTLLALFQSTPDWQAKHAGMFVGEVMSERVIIAKPDESVRTAALRMLEQRVKRLPVLEGGRLVGIVSRHDLLRFFARSDEELHDAVVSILQRTNYIPPWHDITVRVVEGVVALNGTVLYPEDVDVVRAIVSALDGVIGVVVRLSSRENDPRIGTSRNVM